MVFKQKALMFNKMNLLVYTHLDCNCGVIDSFQELTVPVNILNISLEVKHNKFNLFRN